MTEDDAVEPGGFEIKRAIVQHQGSAVMMPVDEKNRILLVRQYRLPARQYLVGTAGWTPGSGRNSVEGRQARTRRRNRPDGQEMDQACRPTIRVPGFVGEKMTLFIAQEI